MIRLIILFFLIQSAFSSSWEGHKIVTGCRIYEMSGRYIVGFPGTFCIFLEDGSYISSTENELKRFDKNNAVMWRIEGTFHHQLGLSRDKKRIFALNSHATLIDQKRIRKDHVMIISLEGKVLHEVFSDELLRSAKIERNPIDPGPVFASAMKIDLEISHFNSMYEIPKLDRPSRLPYLKEGNLVINGRGDGVFVLTPDLKTLIHHFYLPHAREHQVHDVQVLPDGKLLIFNNLTKASTPLRPISSIQEIDIDKEEPTFEFTGSPKGIFYTRVGGSVQKLDKDHYVFVHPHLGTYIYSKAKKDLVSVITSTHFMNGLHFPMFEARVLNLDSFFKSRNP